MPAAARSTARILIVDDDPDVLTAARLLLKPHFADVRTESRPTQLPALVREGRFDAILLDMNFAIGADEGAECLRWLSEILRLDPVAAVVLVTAHSDVSLAVEAMKRGAADFVVKPWENARLIATLTNAANLRHTRLEAAHLREKNRALAAAAQTRANADIVGTSAATRRVLELAARAAPTDANVLILGENGTGKELIAREIHRLSSRTSEVFLSVDLGAVSGTLFESELFGHRKGAFTDAKEDRIGRFQAASGGTLFLDEIGNVPLHLQAKLLTVIERREVTPVGATRAIPVDVRLISATNVPRARLTDENVFRQDLLHRIDTVEIEVPPLRGRREDIPLLVEHFAGIYARKYNLPKRAVTAAALERLVNHAWPGNVRALRHAVERATIMGEGPMLDAGDFALTPGVEKPVDATDETLNLDALERRAIERALTKHKGNVSHAATELGLTRASLYRRMERHGL
jgi:two-component system, NtrC family, response regulator HydG